MKNILITEDCKYAQNKPCLPILKFVEGETYSLEDYLANSVIKNGQGLEDDAEAEDEIELEASVEIELEKPTVEPEIKEKPNKSGKKTQGKKGNKS